MTNRRIPIMPGLAGLLLAAALTTVPGQGALAAEDWLLRASRIGGPPDPAGDPFERGVESGLRNAVFLREAWQMHDELSRAVAGIGLDAMTLRVEAAVEPPAEDKLAELRGVAAGLTEAGFTVDHAKLLGWNAYFESTLPWWSAATLGRVRPVSGTLVGVGGAIYGVQNGDRIWSLTLPDAHTLRFEVAPGDRWQYDSAVKERSELSGPVYAQDEAETITVTYELQVEPGEPNTAEWLVLGQFHADDPDTSPPVSVRLDGERMAVNINFADAEGSIQGMRLHEDAADIERGRYYRLRIEARFATGAEGRLEVWRDGEQIVDYAGPLGYGNGVYWKFGVYRAVSPERFAARYRGVVVTADTRMMIADTPD
jgi:hypothetical protein